MQLWLAGDADPIPFDLIPEVCEELRKLGVDVADEAGTPGPSASPDRETVRAARETALRWVRGETEVIGAEPQDPADTQDSWWSETRV